MEVNTTIIIKFKREILLKMRISEDASLKKSNANSELKSIVPKI